jgi:putative hemolysin
LTEALGLRLERVGETFGRLAQGPLLILANRPYGLVEGCALLPGLLERRPDLKVLADRLLEAESGLREFSLGPGGMAARLARAERHLKAGGAVLAFVGGGLSTGNVRGAKSRAEAAAFARIARSAGASVQAIRLSGGKRRPFLRALGLDKPGWRRIALQGALKGACPKITLETGSPLAAAQWTRVESDAQAAEFVALRLWLLSRRGRRSARPVWNLPVLIGARSKPIASALPAGVVSAELEGLPPESLLALAGDLECRVAQAGQIPNLMREIGRVREETFRAVGEGTGKPLDLDAYDPGYHQLFLWNRKDRQVVGGYRFAVVDRALGLGAPERLYSHSLLRYRPGLLDRLDPALELGRSFVAQEYQRSYAPLQLLWRGIGAWIAANPRYRRLFGLVSMSSGYQPLSRELAASFIKQHLYRGDLARLTRPRRPYLPAYIPSRHDDLTWRLGGDLDRLSGWISEIEPDGKGLPVLFRQYARLGGVFFGFNVDPDFGGALDALVCVDLCATEPKLLERHMGAPQARTFLAWHGRTGAE